MKPGDPNYLTIVVWCTLHGLASFTIDERLGDRGDIGIDELIRLTIQMLIHGLKP